jgi:cation:H+ antiporter
MNLATAGQFLLGLGLLVLGAEWLVRGSSRLASALGVSPLVIGLTIVAYGTSAPEMAVSVKSAWAGQADLAVGNAVGSNIFNVLFILGLSALIVPLRVSSRLIRLDVPIMVGASLLLALLLADGSLGRVDGALLFAGALGYTAFQVRKSPAGTTDTSRSELQPQQSPDRSAVPNVLLAVPGVALLVLGSRWLVAGAVALARVLGVSELIIGLTVVAAGTSLPEVATSILAAARGERDIAVGNVVGSNIFNVLAVLGLAALLSPSALPASPALLRFDLPVMVAVSIACLPVFASGAVIARWEGGLFFFYYLAYTAYLILAARHHDALPAFSAVMETFVLPLTAVTLGVVSWRTWRRRST